MLTYTYTNVNRLSPFFFIAGTTCLLNMNGAVRLTCIKSFHFSNGISSIGATCWIPYWRFKKILIEKKMRRMISFIFFYMTLTVKLQASKKFNLFQVQNLQSSEHISSVSLMIPALFARISIPAGNIWSALLHSSSTCFTSLRSHWT